MKKFDYIIPENLSAAQEALEAQETRGRVVAGGTDLLGTLKDRISPNYPDLLVSLANTGLRYIEEADGVIRIGAMATLHDIETSEAVRERFPLLEQAAHSVASPQIRHQATLGGNVCQEPRCWYYRYPDNKFDCMRKGGKNCNALTGNNPYHSVFGAVKTCASPCETGCPNGTDIPAYINAIRNGNLDEAANIFLEVSPLAAITGRVCPHTCQSECNRNEFDENVMIQNVERFIGDYILDNAEKFVQAPAAGTGKTVGVIGAGPAGLTAAYFLRAKGHSVTVFDKNERAGGMLRYAIPHYRLPARVVDDTVRMLEKAGVVFSMGIAADPAEIAGRFDSVVLASGAWLDNRPEFPGSENALSGLEFLYNCSTGAQEKPGDRVLVIGGGNVAMDAALSAKRLGSDVTIVYRRTREEMPAYEWEQDEALAEGVKLLTSLAPARIDMQGGKVTALKAAKSISRGGRKGDVSLDHDNLVTLEADCVILAVGQKADERDVLFSADGVRKAGDLATGPKSVVDAIADGRKAAYEIHEHLTGEAYRKERQRLGKRLSFDRDALLNSNPHAVKNDAARAEIIDETKRCLNCGCVAVSPSDMAPALLALRAVMVTTKRNIPATEFFKAGIESSTVLENGEILKEIRIPAETAGNVQLYQKFRTRKTIDFPIAGLAANLTVKNGVIESAKLAFNGAAPVPFALTETEEFLTGKKPDEETASAAGRLAVKDMTALAENGFKLRIFQTFVKRAILGEGCK